MNIKYTYLLLARDKVRSQFVKEMVKQYPIIDIEPAIDARDSDSLNYVYKFLQENNITIHPRRYPKNPKYKKDIVVKKTLEAKTVLYVVYLNLLKTYQNYDYLVVLQDDAYFKDKDFDQQIRSLIDSHYVSKDDSARLGQYMSGCIFGKMFYNRYKNSLQKTGIVRPLDHYLAFNGLMKPFKEQIVDVKKFPSNIYGDNRN